MTTSETKAQKDAALYRPGVHLTVTDDISKQRFDIYHVSRNNDVV